jgi:hypothetical protein
MDRAALTHSGALVRKLVRVAVPPRCPGVRWCAVGLPWGLAADAGLAFRVSPHDGHGLGPWATKRCFVSANTLTQALVV